MTLIERIGEYVDEIAPGQPILAGDIYTHVAKAGFTQRDVFNEYLTRYLDTHPDFLRYRRGIYYKTVQTPFGRTGKVLLHLSRGYTSRTRGRGLVTRPDRR